MAGPALYQYLNERSDDLIERFLSELRKREASASGLTNSALRDELPLLFEQVARVLSPRERESLPDHHLPAAEQHGAERWRQGFDLRSIVREFGILQHVIFQDLKELGAEPSLAEIEALLNCLNTAIAQAVTAHAEETDQLNARLAEVQGRLDTSQLRMRMITESIPQIIWTANTAGQSDWFNRQWFQYTGMQEEESLGWGWLDAVHVDDRERAQLRWEQSLRDKREFELEYRLRRRDGQFHWFLGRAIAASDARGDVLKWFGTCTDIDQQKATEARLRAATEHSEQLNRLKDEFLATVSHELRTPLQSILGWSRLLKSGHVTSDKVARALDTIERNAKVQTQLIDDILDVSRIITGKARIRAEPVDVATVLSAALDTTQPAARAKGVELTADVPADIGFTVGDADRLQQVVWNLLSNAVKFTPPGGHVRLTARRSAQVLSIVVEDDGQGIPAHFLPHAFDRFRQADAGATRAHGGLGLGLAIVRHLVELHGGTVSVASEGEGRGATFSVWLPPHGPAASQTPSRPLPGRRSEPAFPSVGALSDVRVLLVEDQPDARELISTVLQQYGADVTEAGSAAEAYAYLTTQRFHVLVSDIGLPQEDGYSLIRRVRALNEPAGAASIPALAVTAYARREDQKLALEAGYDRHVTKPVDPAQLVASVARLTRGPG
jgi:PAS domain S-box-containing protein